MLTLLEEDNRVPVLLLDLRMGNVRGPSGEVDVNLACGSSWRERGHSWSEGESYQTRQRREYTHLPVLLLKLGESRLVFFRDVQGIGIVAFLPRPALFFVADVLKELVANLVALLAALSGMRRGIHHKGEFLPD